MLLLPTIISAADFNNTKMPEDVFKGLCEIFADIFRRFDLVLTGAMKTGDIDGWDSFKNVEILLACEERWEIRFSSREIDGIRTVGDLANCVAAKISPAN